MPLFGSNTESGSPLAGMELECWALRGSGGRCVEGFDGPETLRRFPAEQAGLSNKDAKVVFVCAPMVSGFTG